MATKRKQYPSQARLRELFDYDPEGFLVWKWRDDRSLRWNNQFSGMRAGRIGFGSGGEYRSVVSINNISYSLMIIMWIYHNGELPEGIHVRSKGDIFSGIKKEQLYTTKNPKTTHLGRKVHDNSTGFKGVKKRRSGGFQAQSGKGDHLGTFYTKEGAAAAFNKWGKLNYGEGFIENDVPDIDFEKDRIIKAGSQISGHVNKNGFRGVCKNKPGQRNPWRSLILINGRQKHLGTFPTKEQAARAYNIAAYEHYGEHAVLNDIPDPLGKLQADEEDVF